MAYNTQHQQRDEKALRRKRFLKRMEAKLRMKEAMQDHDTERRHNRFSTAH